MARTLLWPAVLSAVLSAPSSVSAGAGAGEGTPESPLDISMIALISDPAAYDGLFVRVEGYLSLEFEGTAIYLHREDCENFLCRNGLWVEVPSGEWSEWTGRYVLLEGWFDSDEKGHMGLWSGSITAVGRLAEWGSTS